MYGCNVTDKTFSYDNRPQVPLYNMDFDQWWLVSLVHIKSSNLRLILNELFSMVTKTTLLTRATSSSFLPGVKSTASSLATRALPPTGLPLKGESLSHTTYIHISSSGC